MATQIAAGFAKPEVKGKSFGETVARLIVPPVQGDDYDLGWLVERERRDFLRFDHRTYQSFLEMFYDCRPSLTEGQS